MKRTKQILSVFLSFCMIISCMVGMSLTAYAADEVSENISLVNGQSLVLGTHYSVSGEFENESGIHVYNKDPMTINARKGETITKVVLTYNWGNYKSSLSASPGTFDGNATISDINAQQVTISSSDTRGVKISAVTVYFEGSLSNPTVTLTGGANAKSSGGLLTQSYLPGAMDTVTYTALTGATFPAFENFTQNGVTVKRTSDTVVTVSGTPTANTEITVPDAESSSKIVTWGSSIIKDSGRNGIVYQIRRNNSYSDTANGITLTKSGDGNVGSADWYSYGSLELNFTTATGKFISIEIETGQILDGGNWTKDGNTLKWNGTPSNSVSLSGSRLYLEGVSSINFVIEMPTVSVTITPGSNMTKTTDSGAASQTGLSGAMTAVVYTANEGYYFPTDYNVTAVNGISVTRNNYTQITVSGTPSANAEITLTAPTAKTTPDAPTTAAATDCTTANNNDGKLTGVTADMEYKKSDAENWTAGTGSDITGLVPGTYYVRIKATDTANASANQELTIAEYTALTYTVTLTGGANATLSGGDATQSGLSGAMSTVTYTANSGYHFAEFDATTTTGITMTRTSDTVITISGKPTADTNITVPDAVADSASITYTLVPAKAATCTATGNKEYYKGSDGKYYTKSGEEYTETTLAAVTIAKTAHTLTAVAAVDAKCTTDGTKAHYKCSVCEKLFEDADGKTETTADALKVAALGHNYVGGTCTRCGAADPNYGGGHYTPYIPSGSTTTTTTTTNTGSFADKTEENNNYAGAEINMKTEDLEKAVLTDEDKKVIAAGGNVTVELEVEEKTPTAEEKKEVEAAVEAAKETSGKDYTVAMYFDANLFKTSNGTKTQLHETNGKIAVSFKLPAQFKNTDSSVTRTYAVARIHDGKTEILVCEYDPETDLLTFYTDKFSTYALMYEDAKADDADVSAVDDDDEQGDEGAVDDEQFDETDDDFDELTDDEGDFDDDFAEDQTDGDSDTDNDDQAAVDAVVDNGETNPHTGAPLAGMGVFAVMSFFAAAAAYTAKKRKNK